MGEYIVIARFTPKDGKSDEFIAGLKPLLDYAHTIQDEIPVIYLLKEETDEGEPQVVTFSSFKNKESHLSLLQSSQWKTLATTLESKSLLTKPQTEEILHLATGFTHRPSSPQTNAIAILANLKIFPGKKVESLSHWKKITAYVEENETEAGSYCFSEVEGDDDVLCIFERYSSKEYFKDVHLKSDVLAANRGVQAAFINKAPGVFKFRFWREVGNSRA